MTGDTEQWPWQICNYSLKGDTKLPENVQLVFHLQALYGGFISTHATEVCLWVECEIFEGAAILLHSLYYEQQ